MVWPDFETLKKCPKYKKCPNYKDMPRARTIPSRIVKNPENACFETNLAFSKILGSSLGWVFHSTEPFRYVLGYIKLPKIDVLKRTLHFPKFQNLVGGRYFSLRSHIDKFRLSENC